MSKGMAVIIPSKPHIKIRAGLWTAAASIKPHTTPKGGTPWFWAMRYCHGRNVAEGRV